MLTLVERFWWPATELIMYLRSNLAIDLVQHFFLNERRMVG